MKKTWVQPIENVSLDTFRLAASFFLALDRPGIFLKTTEHKVCVDEVLGMRKIYRESITGGGIRIIEPWYRLMGKCTYRVWQNEGHGSYTSYEGKFVATYNQNTHKGELRFFELSSYSGTDES